MGKASIYRMQHEELERIIATISGDLPAGTPAALRQSLSRLAGVLKMHLAMEDKQMYPRMLAHTNPEVRATAAEYQRTMGDLAPVFAAFYDKWNSEEAIDFQRPQFTQAMQGIITALGERIKLENENLYDLIDREQISVD